MKVAKSDFFNKLVIFNLKFIIIILLKGFYTAGSPYFL